MAPDVVSHTKMHADELDIDDVLVRGLVATQFPSWAHLPLERVASVGTDNAIFRLGDTLAVRLPRRVSATAQVDKEQRWLPILAPHLPLAVPSVLAVGKAGAGYPWRWCIVRWLDGNNATVAAFADPHRAARDLGAFIHALQCIDPAKGPPPGRHNFYRGVPLAVRDRQVRRSIPHWHGLIDVRAAAAVWESILGTPPWHRPGLWIHGDLGGGNVLVHEGRLSAVIDFGCLGVGDPACDLMAAWSLFSADARRTFRHSLHADEATWNRARGWALATSVGVLPYYKDTNPAIVASARRTLEAVLDDGL